MPDLITVDDAAARLSLSRRTIHKLIADGTLRSVKIGGARRIPVDALDDYLADDEQAQLDRHIDALVSSWPKATPAQLDKLRRLFTQPSAERVSA
jgi:excisionase family DNA binding protein